MVFEGCQGKNKVGLTEKRCPVCGSIVELAPEDVYVDCDVCGHKVFGPYMECSRHCAGARECLGEELYNRMMAANEKWRSEEEELQDDEW